MLTIFRYSNSFFCWHDSFLQGLFSDIFRGGVLNYQKKDFINCFGIMTVRQWQNANNIEKCLYSSTHFSKTTGLMAFEKVANEFSVLLE